MNTADSTQLASDGKRGAVSEFEESNHYNDRYNRISAQPLLGDAGAAHCLNHVHRALQGIAVVNTLLTNDRYSSDNGCEPLDGYMTGGLHSAIQALAEMAIDKIEFYADRIDEVQQENQAVSQ
ncbi:MULTISPECIES: hypothetical protein [unclassified Caballeronia]|uniref:hypothetical protein n=1 Tax=unclassified Caballeronia TaxID=2646786 RepID=UPI002856603B|nr:MULTISPECIES: hypothetical protein [unclassified Caballeronia]MDR5777366.1 hypothetical protein [Caballeronia sp. LZ002]MDR5802538.1 hypothetical protein [Caballeronia sp. LZ001]MDR5852804.1 hypothetical protein [Caballeronia sp. LZ003]